MPAFSIRRDIVPAVEQSDIADAKIIARIRLVLGIAILLSAPADPNGTTRPEVLLLGSYVAAALLLWLAAEADLRFAWQGLVHWADLMWCFLVLNTGNSQPGFFYLFFFFIILSAGVRRGFDEGAKVTLFGALGHIITSGNIAKDNLDFVFVQTVFLCALGYLVAQFGEHRLQMRRRFALLRELAQPANPRLGVDHTVTGMMERTRAFFGADRCVLVLRAEGGCTVRTVHAGSPLSVPREPIGEESAAPFLGFAAGTTLLYRHGRLARPIASYPLERRHWVAQAPLAFERVADLLEADTFISAPVVLANASGRLFVSRSRQPFTRSDALFLSQAVAQAVPVVENLAMLDRMASEAAWTERQRLALNVHDSAVQPYIGLALGLSALRRKAGPDNPLVPELDALGSMVQSVIADLRAYAGSVACRDGDQQHGALCGAALARLAAQMRERYGLRVSLDIEAGGELGDRLAAEVIQIVREGLNNIGKHTKARQGEVRVRRGERVLQIEIDNESGEGPVRPFVPHSIRERAAALGGTVQVRSARGATAVCVEIPI